MIEDYSDALLDHFQHPRNAGRFSKQTKGVRIGRAGSPAQGAVIELQIRLGEGNRIEEARFMAYGCPATIACASLTTERLEAKTLEQARRLHNSELAAALELPPQKIHCAVLAEAAVRAAVGP